MDFETLSKGYLALGAGGLSLIVLIWLLVHQVVKINPVLHKLGEDNEAHKEVIKNNTDAIREVSRSNENVASALGLLENSFSTLVRLMDRHDLRAEGMSMDITRVCEKLNNLDRD